MFPNLHFLNFKDLTLRVGGEQCAFKPAVLNWHSEEQKQGEVKEQNVCRWELLNLSQFHTCLFFVVQFYDLMPGHIK